MFYSKFLIVIILALAAISEAQWRGQNKDFKGRNPNSREKKGYTNISPKNDNSWFNKTNKTCIKQNS